MTTSADLPEQPHDPRTSPAALPPAEPPTSARFFQWIRSLGVQRSSNRWVGGVCGGLAAKWGIDPVIVRGLAVVLTLFFGIGLLAYGAAWALLPEPDGRIHSEEVSRGRWSTGMTGAAIATLFGLGGPGSGLFWGGNDGWSLWSVVWIGGIAWLIYWSINRSRSKGPLRPGQQGPAAPRTSTQPWQGPLRPPEPGAPAPQGGDHGMQGAYPWAQNLQSTPAFQPNPALYVKNKAVKTTPHLGAAGTFLAMGLATVIGAAVLLLDASAIIDLRGYEAGVAAAAAAVAAGIGIVIASLLGRTAGGLGTFGTVALVFAGLLCLDLVDTNFSSFEQSTWAPATVDAAEAGKSLAFGNATLDLTKLDGGTALSADVEVPLNIVASNAKVLIPEDVPVELKSELAAASLIVDGENIARSIAENFTTELNPDAQGKTLVITLQGAASNVELVVDHAP